MSIFRKIIKEQLLLHEQENSKKEKTINVLTTKIGLDWDVAELVFRTMGKLSLWFTNALLKHWMEGSSESKEQILKKWNNSAAIQQRVNTYMRQIVDWLRHPISEPQNLKDLTLYDALRKAEEFHDSLKSIGGTFDYTETDEIVKEYTPTEDDTKFYWAYIPSNFCSRESERMGHCGRAGSGSILFSLRSIKPHGQHTITDSHVTIAYNTYSGKIMQCKGKKNQHPEQIYHPYIFDFILLLINSDQFTHFLGFGSEYNSQNDYGWNDMTTDQLKQLYKLEPALFTSYAGQKILGKHGIIKLPKRKTKFTLKLATSDVKDYVDAGRDYSDDIFEKYLDGDYDHDYYGDYHYWKDFIDDLNKQNERKVWKHVIHVLGRTKKDLLKEYKDLEEVVKDNSDDLDNLTNAIDWAVEDGMSNDYVREVVKYIISALETFGTVTNNWSEGITIECDLNNFDIEDEYMEDYIERCEGDPSCIFNEAKGDNVIEKARFRFDDRYTGYCEKNVFNDFVSDRLSELEGV